MESVAACGILIFQDLHSARASQYEERARKREERCSNIRQVVRLAALMVNASAWEDLASHNHVGIWGQCFIPGWRQSVFESMTLLWPGLIEWNIWGVIATQVGSPQEILFWTSARTFIVLLEDAQRGLLLRHYSGRYLKSWQCENASLLHFPYLNLAFPFPPRPPKGGELEGSNN